MGVGLVRCGRLIFIVFIFLVFLPVSVCAETAGLEVKGIRYGGTGTKTRIVFDLNRKTDFRAFLLDQPYRIVVDLPQSDWKIARSQFVSGNSTIKSYRSGTLDDGLTRVIFDLKKTTIIDNIFTLDKNSTNKDRLVIDIKPASVNAFNAQKSRVFGNRQLKGTGEIKTSSGSGYTAVENDLVKAAVPEEASKAAPVLRQPQKMYTVVIDAGHGGEDPGAVVGNVREKFITLAVAQEIRRQLEETGRYKVVLTRDKDFYVKLRDRLDISRQVKGDLFVSVHADKIERKGVRGASIYTLSEKASDAETARLAEDENNSGFVAGVDLSQESQDVADILLDLAMREKMNESNLFARMLGDAFRRKNVRLLPNSHRSAGFAVLKAPDVPSVLIEIGFLSNPEEAKLLSSGQFQRNTAAAVLVGIDGYFRKIQSLDKR